MKSVAVLLVLVCAAASADPRKPQQPPAPGLRQVVEQYDTVRKAPQPRELSPAERAELRRQVTEFGHRDRRH
jgi:hypothetical protein